jgi:hypothetical protein
MKAASLQDIKVELNSILPDKLLELCLRLAKFKKENKELLSYLLFEAHNTEAYISNVKLFIADEFLQVNTSNIYYAKKTFRKILRITNKYIKYCGLPQVEVELLIYFCLQLKQYSADYQKSNVLINLYNQQLKKISKTIANMHEDLQYDYMKAYNELL